MKPQSLYWYAIRLVCYWRNDMIHHTYIRLSLSLFMMSLSACITQPEETAPIENLNTDLTQEVNLPIDTIIINDSNQALEDLPQDSIDLDTFSLEDSPSVEDSIVLTGDIQVNTILIKDTIRLFDSTPYAVQIPTTAIEYPATMGNKSLKIILRNESPESIHLKFHFRRFTKKTGGFRSSTHSQMDYTTTTFTLDLKANEDWLYEEDIYIGHLFGDDSMYFKMECLSSQCPRLQSQVLENDTVVFNNYQNFPETSAESQDLIFGPNKFVNYSQPILAIRVRDSLKCNIRSLDNMIINEERLTYNFHSADSSEYGGHLKNSHTTGLNNFHIFMFDVHSGNSELRRDKLFIELSCETESQEEGQWYSTAQYIEEHTMNFHSHRQSGYLLFQDELLTQQEQTNSLQERIKPLFETL